ncbi:glycogen/starch/alpha-glucan phosphorylase [Brevirhabdus sp.]|uniref:glycogen/starch/alpha-glucan phosphorylase n=1 Tax=Brevirhabdus sp. TaxID=2004514 RepID=UPI0040592883
MTFPTRLLRDDLLERLKFDLGRDAQDASLRDWRMAVSLAVRARIVTPWLAARRAAEAAGAKQVYYLSMEFLIGRLLEDAIVNLGLDGEVNAALTELGLDYDRLVEDEPDAALGNGGLGRLAACFMESLATLGCPAYGYGIRYEHGIFRQDFEDGRQVEHPEDWLSEPHAWEFERPGEDIIIGFGGHVREDGARAVWTADEHVVARPFDMPIIGWQGRWANTLRLWGARPTDGFDLSRFNRGDFAAAAENEALARTISRVLYPDDTTEQGKTLRLKQEYFFTAASLRDLLRRFVLRGRDLRSLPQHVAIQMNDTHPAIAGPELVRLLHDEHAMEFDDAIDTARACLAYTNHTLLPEALETWSEGLMAHLLPRHMRLIERIDHRHAMANPARRTSVVDHGHVKMGELSFIMANRVNGVSALHTELMKKTVFSELHGLHPDRIVNQTNGVTPRRWLKSSNPRLSTLISSVIEGDWLVDLDRLAELDPLCDDAGFLTDFAGVKQDNKVDLANWLARDHGFSVDPAAMFDVQIKRIHEYKRQHLNILEAIALWQDMRANPQGNHTPRVKIFGGKAAPGYVLAKEIIELINAVAAVVNADPLVRGRLTIAFLPNYNVSMAERLIPAADLSEQISTAGKEASGTGNMKFALNGAPTIGTLDGANVEIRERVGAENFFLFGMTAEQVVARRALDGHAAAAIAADPRLARALQAIRDGAFSGGDGARFAGVCDNVMGPDYFLVASDFADYWRAQRQADAVFRDTDAWTRMAARNTARSGWFSSDRTIRDYMAQIWQASSVT